MGMSTHVIGLKKPDEKWEKMKKIWDSCADIGVDPPKEVDEYFDYEEPDSSGMEVEVPHREWSGDMRSGIEIDWADIPTDVMTIRFYNSW